MFQKFGQGLIVLSEGRNAVIARVRLFTWSNCSSLGLLLSFSIIEFFMFRVAWDLGTTKFFYRY